MILLLEKVLQLAVVKDLMLIITFASQAVAGDEITFQVQLRDAYGNILFGCQATKNAVVLSRVRVGGSALRIKPGGVGRFFLFLDRRLDGSARSR